jgi:Flp pilus assembly protein TadG
MKRPPVTSPSRVEERRLHVPHPGWEVPCERTRSYRGTAALEFVMVLPVLMVIVVGAVDFSRIAHLENVLTNAARAGAACGATHGVTDYIRSDWEARIVQQTANEASHITGFDTALLNVDIETIPEADGSLRVQVSVEYPFDMIIHWPGWPDQFVLRRSVSMRRYR